MYVNNLSKKFRIRNVKPQQLKDLGSVRFLSFMFDFVQG